MSVAIESQLGELGIRSVSRVPCGWGAGIIWKGCTNQDSERNRTLQCMVIVMGKFGRLDLRRKHICASRIRYRDT